MASYEIHTLLKGIKFHLVGVVFGSIFLLFIYFILAILWIVIIWLKLLVFLGHFKLYSSLLLHCCIFYIVGKWWLISSTPTKLIIGAQDQKVMLICPKVFSVAFQNINGILLPKLFWPTVRKNCSSDREKLLKFKADGLNNLFQQWMVRTIFGPSRSGIRMGHMGLLPQRIYNPITAMGFSANFYPLALDNTKR